MRQSNAGNGVGKHRRAGSKLDPVADAEAVLAAATREGVRQAGYGVPPGTFTHKFPFPLNTSWERLSRLTQTSSVGGESVIEQTAEAVIP
jgi:hypothetical protein